MCNCTSKVGKIGAPQTFLAITPSFLILGGSNFSPYVHHTLGNVLDQFLPIFIKIRYALQGSKVDLSDGYILDSVLDDLSKQ